MYVSISQLSWNLLLPLIFSKFFGFPQEKTRQERITENTYTADIDYRGEEKMRRIDSFNHQIFRLSTCLTNLILVQVKYLILAMLYILKSLKCCLLSLLKSHLKFQGFTCKKFQLSGK